ncbi:MAG: hypothetical protein WC449_05290 [Candidatus Paceibacterota bacterium]
MYTITIKASLCCAGKGGHCTSSIHYSTHISTSNLRIMQDRLEQIQLARLRYHAITEGWHYDGEHWYCPHCADEKGV